MFKLFRGPARWAGLLIFALAATPLAALQFPEVDQGYPGVRVEQLATGLGIPWGMTFLSPRQMLITERGGSIRLGQGGLLDVAAGPDFANDGWIYFTFSKPVDSEAATTLARARLRENRLVDWQELLVTDSATGTRRHFGSRIAFDDQGHVFFGVGDRGERDMAQNLGNHIGGIMRLRVDGSIPAMVDRTRPPRRGRNKPDRQRA
jgi:glucose/arabinose dehydrogenase